VAARSVHVPNDRLREHARRLLTATRVDRHDLALAFEDSCVTTAEVLVEGRSFYPPMLADIEAATSSVHINQFGFRPGKVGDVFARALAEKARS
jgi:phosphatidylserine/phosphatidylglycerophosphate/cardiolipin synthase-like enzyme